jgi:hypothetical protein
MKTYTIEDFKTDDEWLEGQGVDTEERADFIINLIKAGFKMSHTEFVEFMEKVKYLK